MYTVTYTNTDGNQMKLLLTDAEFERGLHRAQENASDTLFLRILNLESPSVRSLAMVIHVITEQSVGRCKRSCRTRTHQWLNVNLISLI